MSFGPFESKSAQAIVKSLCKGKSTARFEKLLQSALDAEMSATNFDPGGISSKLGDQCLAAADIIATGRGHAGKVKPPVAAQDWLDKGAVEFSDELADLGRRTVEKIRKESAAAAISAEMGGWPAWTGYCRSLVTRLKKPRRGGRPQAAAKKAEPQGIEAVVKGLRSKKCDVQQEKKVVVELACRAPNQLGDEDLKDIALLTGLRRLVLVGQPVTDKGLSPLSALTQLRELTLKDSRVKGQGLGSVGLPQLQSLELGESSVNKAIAHCRQLTGLRHLNLFGSDLTDKGLEGLDFAQKLESLTIGQCQRVKGVGFGKLHDLKKLRAIDAVRVPLSQKGLDALCGLTSLRELDLMFVDLSRRDLSNLQKLNRLENLSLGHTQIDDEQLAEFLPKLRKLKVLDLSDNPDLTDAAVVQIARLPALQELSLSSPQITAASVDVIAGMKQLSELDLSGTDISRAAQKRLEKGLR